jgi:hypothetical protein
MCINGGDRLFVLKIFLNVFMYFGKQKNFTNTHTNTQIN